MTTEPKPIPPMPSITPAVSYENVAALESWGRDLVSRLEAAQALAGELAEALEGLESLFDKMEKGFEYPAEVRFAVRDSARSALAHYREATLPHSSQPQA